MENFSEVEIQVSKRDKALFDLSHPVNTTHDFFEVQPLLVQELPLADTTVNYRVDSVVRLAPLVAPSFGDLYFSKIHRFVANQDVYPYYNDVLAVMPVTIKGVSTVIEKVPHISSLSLSLMFLIYSDIKVYRISSSGWSLTQTAPSLTEFRTIAHDLFNIPSELCDALYDNIPSGNWLSESTTGIRAHDYFTPESSDFVIESGEYAITLYLDERGRRLFKFFNACGYTVNFNYQDDTEVHLLPLLCCAKAYFDEYQITAFENYKDSAIFKLYNYYIDNIPSDLSWSTTQSNTNEFKLVREIIDLLANSFATDKIDFLSAHFDNTSRHGNMTSVKGDNLKAKFVDEYGNSTTASSANRFAEQFWGNGRRTDVSSRNMFTQLDDELLKKMYYDVERASAIGYQLREALLARGYSEFVETCESHFIGRETLPIEIREVTSMADTLQEVEVSGKVQEVGDVLGSYSGKAVASAYGQEFSYTCKNAGYLIVLSSVVCNSFNIQGLHPSVIGSTRYDLYNPEFDGFGLEASPKSIAGKHDQLFENTAVKESGRFGYVPRMSKHKVSFALCNGDMLRHSFRDSYLPYQLDKFITPYYITSERSDVDKHKYDVSRRGFRDSVPTAGKVWRYPTLAKWRSNLNRIFRLFNPEKLVLFQEFYFGHQLTVDNFMNHNYVNLKMYSRMLPISESFDTIEDENAKTITISRN